VAARVHIVNEPDNYARKLVAFPGMKGDPGDHTIGETLFNHACRFQALEVSEENWMRVQGGSKDVTQSICGRMGLGISGSDFARLEI
jgi:hypothetical protein